MCIRAFSGIYLVLGLILVFLAGIGCTQIGIIKDRNLERDICEQLGIEPEDLTEECLQTITELELPGSGIKTLRGIQHCTNLEYLDLSSNDIGNLAPLSGMASLEVLYVSGNNIQDVLELSSCVNLRYLDLSGNLVEDIGPITECMNLRWVKLRGNPLNETSEGRHIEALRDRWVSVVYEYRND